MQRADDAQVEGIAFGIADQTAERLGRRQIDVGLERLRGHSRSLVGCVAKRLEVELAVAGIDAAVVVDIRRRDVTRIASNRAQRQIDGLAIESVHLAVTGGVACHCELQTIGSRCCAGDFQQLQAGLGDAEQCIGTCAVRAGNQRRQPRNDSSG